MTRGTELNNPLNLMTYPTITWAGEIKPSADAEGRLCQFDTMINGIRAGAKNLLAYNTKDECDTIRKIITRYAPAVENPTVSYVSFVAQGCGVGADNIVDLTSAPLLKTLVGAIIHFEQGGDVCTDDEIAQGCSEALASLPIS